MMHGNDHGRGVNGPGPKVIDQDPITDEELADIEISLDELRRGEYVTIPPDATKEDVSRTLLSIHQE